MKPEKTTNPIVTLDRVLRKTERVIVTSSFVLVLGTVGYLSFHALT